MSNFQQVGRELQSLERVHAELAGIAARTDERRRHDLIELRRRFSEQLADVGRLAEPIFESRQDPSLAQAYRGHFSRLRSAAATHQAQWPAVRIDEASELYRRSAVAVTEAHREFVAWMRETLARLEKEG
jgi:arylamine N-acetyltransferase